MSGAQLKDGFVVVTKFPIAIIAIIAMRHVVQAVGSLRGEETGGCLEPRLSGTLSRMRRLAAHGLVIVTGLVVIIVISSVVLAAATTWPTGSTVHLGRFVSAEAAYLPAQILVGGLALALFGLSPTAFPAGWATFAFLRFINPPLGTVQALRLVVLGTIAVALGLAAAVGLRHRRVPQG